MKKTLVFPATGAILSNMKFAKPALILAGISFAIFGMLRAADNGVSAPKWSADKPGSVKWRTTDTAGVHVQHIIVDSGVAATAPKQYTGTPSSFTPATADGTVFTLAAGEVGFIQNLDSADALAVKKGASASTSSFSFILGAGSAQDDGKGGYAVIKDWVGAVSVATMSGTARYIAWKQAP